MQAIFYLLIHNMEKIILSAVYGLCSKRLPLTRQAKWSYSQVIHLLRDKAFPLLSRHTAVQHWHNFYTLAMAALGCECVTTAHQDRGNLSQSLQVWIPRRSLIKCLPGGCSPAPHPSACLPASLLPADGGVAHTAPGASDAVLRLNPAPAAFHEETPASPGPELPCLHLYRKAAPHLQT